MIVLGSTMDKPKLNTLKLCTLKKAILIFFHGNSEEELPLIVSKHQFLALLFSQRFAIIIKSSMKVLSIGERVKRVTSEKQNQNK